MADAARRDAAAAPPPKRARAALGEDAQLWKPSGENVNLIEAGGKSCTHEVLWPPPESAEGGGAGGGDAAAAEGAEERSPLPPPPRPGPPARTYPFPLDPFQQTAVNCLEARHNVLVAAHTSAGKTVVAEYAFAMALRDGQRVIYTSPLKALSNQKYRELREEFGDVGLMTGDVTIDPNASCLVMTTEILRSMLYRGSEVVREVGLLVYDEVHYLRDAERGVVWEESIALAPRGCRMAFLSATLPNAAEFAGWVAATHGSPCHVVYTDYRPTPLQHFIYPAGHGGLYMVVDEGGTFREDNFQKAVAAIAGAGVEALPGDAKGKGDAGKKRTERDVAQQDMLRLVARVMEEGLHPFIVFALSKRECEAHAGALHVLDLTTDDEKAAVDSVFKAAIDVLSDDDRRLPQIARLLPMLRRGVGVHHSGQLPILKEVVELLFQEGLVKVLFATETFSTGLNMPARTVAFTRARKFDGQAFRWVSSGEYIQMSGRAGRRGKDKRGVVILMLDAKMEPAVAKAMIKGSPDALTSAFSLRYSMILGLARVEGASPEALLARSFRQWQARRALPALQARAAALEARAARVAVADEAAAEQLLELIAQRVRLADALRAATTANADVALRFLQPGRLVRVAAAPPDPARELPQLGPVPRGAGVGDDGGDADGGAEGDASSGAPDGKQEGGKEEGGASAAAAADGGGGPDGSSGAAIDAILERVDGAAWGVLVSFEKAGKARPQQQQAPADTLGGGDDGDGSAFRTGGGASGSSSNSSGPRFAVDVLVACDPATLPKQGGARALPRVVAPGTPGASAQVVTFPLEHLAALSSVRMRALADLRPPSAREAALTAAAEVIKRQRAAAAAAAAAAGGGSGSGAAAALLAAAGPPLLDPQRDMKAAGKDVDRIASRLESLDSRIAAHPLARRADVANLLGALQAKRALAAAARSARREAKAAAGVVLLDELKARSRVLRRLGYLDDDGLVTTKGRVAADLQVADELVLTELVFGGAFNGLKVPELVALASCFVWTERSAAGVRLAPELQALYRTLHAAATRVGKVAAECKAPLGGSASSPAEYADGFRPELMAAAHAWARGQRFAEVIKIADVFEGSLVRAVRRLEELLRQVAGALRGVGDAELAARFDEAGAAIKRDVIFAASLYL